MPVALPPDGIMAEPISQVPTPLPSLPSSAVPEPAVRVANPHTSLIQSVAAIGAALGREVHKAYNAPYKYDAPLAKNQYVLPDIVVEVCDKGSVDKDFSSLNWARETWNAKGLLIVVDDADFKKAQIVVGKTPNIFVMRPDTLKQVEALVAAGYVPALKAILS